jgi:hypothetical protein
MLPVRRRVMAPEEMSMREKKRALRGLILPDGIGLVMVLGIRASTVLS